MTRSLIMSLAALALLPAFDALAQQSSVYIGQVDPNGRSGSPRRSDGSATTGAAYSGAGGYVSPTELGLNPMASTDLGSASLQSTITAAGRAGSGAAALTGNVAVINQLGSSNTGTINQSGLSNSAEANVTGTGNRTRQDQDGSNNRSVIGLSGDANDVTSVQSGSLNSSNVTFTGSGYTVSTSQSGVGLSYSLSTTGTGAPAISGKSITVTQTGVGPGITVTTSGLPNALAGSIRSR